MDFILVIVICSGESHATFITLEELNILVCSFVAQHVSLRDKFPQTKSTRELFNALVNFYVMDHAALGLKFLPANFIRALVLIVLT